MKNIRRRKSLLAAALSLALAFALAACQGAAFPEPVVEKATNDEATVYYLNPDAALDAQWQELASRYSQETGVPVRVLSPEEGTYEETLAEELSKIEGPTVFAVSGPAALETWGGYALDLSGSPLLEGLRPGVSPLTEGEAPRALPYDLSAAALLVNNALLEQAGHSLEELSGLAGLRAAAEDITARREELGFAAFASPGLKDARQPGSAALLANAAFLAGEAEGFSGRLQELWDLTAQNAVSAPAQLSGLTPEDGQKEFTGAKAVFCLADARDWADIQTAMPDAGLSLLPVYAGGEAEAAQGLCLYGRQYWCVNKDADLNDTEAALAFLSWCLSSESGTAALAAMGYALPSQTAPAPENPLIARALSDAEGGKTAVPWALPTDGEAESALNAALAAYAAGGAWDGVPAVFGGAA